MRKFYFLSVFLFVCFFVSRAQFSGGYAPAKWTLYLPPPSNGSVDVSSAPGSITLTGSDDAGGASTNNVDVDYTITAIASGVWSFSWTYTTNDVDADPQYDLAGVVVNGVFQQLTNNTGGVSQSGNFTGSVSAGDVIGFRIRAVDNIFGNATFSITSFSPPGGVLPVVLQSFTAQKAGTSALLRWQAATEINTAFYRVERSTAGGPYEGLGEVKAQGAALPYAFRDAHPAAGINRYRLRMVDADGQWRYSKVVAVRFDANSRFTVYPNPARHFIVLRLSSEQTGTDVMRIYSAGGAVMKSATLRMPADSRQVTVPVDALPGGLYFVQVGSGSMQSFVKE